MIGTVEFLLRPYSEDGISVVVIDMIQQRGARKEGTASKALDWLCALADILRVILYLSPEPIDSIFLLTWYGKRKFTPVEYNYMKRDPQMIKIEAETRLRAAEDEGPHVVGLDSLDEPDNEGTSDGTAREPKEYEPAEPSEPSEPSKPTTGRRKINAGRETGKGAGALFYAEDTGNFLLCLRGPNGDEPDTWCGLGGGVEAGETMDEAVRREAFEEAQFPEDSPCDLRYIGCQKSPDFEFHNYLGILPREFTPVLNDEHTDYRWCKWDDFPEGMHPKFMEAMESDTGQKLIRQHTTAFGDPDAIEASTDHLRTEEFKKGYADCKAGKKLADNPYHETIAKGQWKLGWYKANDEY